MRVSLILDLVNRLGRGRKAAERDLAAVKKAAGDVGTARGGEKVSRDLERIAPAARKATQELRGARAAAAQVGNAPGPRQLGRDLDQAGGKARRLKREIEGVGKARRELGRTSATGPIVPTGGGNSAGAGVGAAALAAGRGALLPLAAAYGGYRGVTSGVRGTVGQSISFEKAMAEVRKKVDGMDDPKAFAAMERSISKWAITYGRTREEVAALVAEAGAGGVSQADMPEFARINLAASTAWDVSASQAGNALAKIRAATQWSNAELEVFVDKVNALADAGSAKEMDVVDMFQRAGAAAKDAGVDFDASLAFLTAMNNVAIAPEVAARGFAAFSSKLRTATNQPKKVAEGLTMLGLSANTVEKGMKADATATMINVLERLDKHADKAAVAIKVFGQEWWDEVARAGQALPEIRKALDIVRDPKKHLGSAQGNLNIELATTANHLTRLKAQASEVGDRLGRWALPAINEAIEKIIAGMDALEQRAARGSETERLAGKVAAGEALTPEERAKLSGDRQRAAAVSRRAGTISAQKDYDDTAARTAGSAPDVALRERAALLRRQLERQISTIETELRLTPDGYGDRRKRQRLGALRRQLGDLPLDANQPAGPGRTDGRRPADQADRAAQRAGMPDRAAVMALQERLRQLDANIQILTDLAASSRSPADRAGFLGDAEPLRRRRAEAVGTLARTVAPQLVASGRFGLNGPTGTSSGTIGAGRFGLGLGGGTGAGGQAAWAQTVRDSLDIDLGAAGMTIGERFALGLRSSIEGVDLGGAATTSMDSYAAGITAGGAKAVAAARAVGDQVRAAMTVTASASLSTPGTARPRAVSGALHDGVD